MLARSLCRAHRVSLLGIAAGDRWGKLRVEAAGWQPFDDCEHVAVVQGDVAWLYAWDRAAFERRCGETAPAKVSRVLPETVLYAPPPSDGARLLRCVDGCTGEIWAGPVMVATRWWPAPPDAQEWALFLRAAGQADLDSEPPRLIDPDLSRASAAWGQARRLTESSAGDAARAGWWMPFLAVALTVPMIWLARDLWVVEHDLQALEAEQTALEGQASSPARLRQETLAALSSAEAVQQWLNAPAPVLILAELTRRLPDDGSVVRRFELADGRMLMALAPAPRTPRIAYVSALESSGVLTAVREEAGEGREAGWVVLRAEAVAPAAAAASAAAVPSASATTATTATTATSVNGPAAAAPKPAPAPVAGGAR